MRIAILMPFALACMATAALAQQQAPTGTSADATTPPAPTLPAERKPDVQRARVVGYFAPVVPTLKISASTSGKTDFQLGLDVLHALWGHEDDWDIHFLPMLAAGTETGSENIFSFADSKASTGAPWTIGLTVAFSKLGLAPEPLAGRMAERARDRAAMRTAAQKCVDRCASANQTPDEQAFCSANGSRSTQELADLDPGDLCKKGQEQFTKDTVSDNELYRTARGIFPSLDLSVGIAGGIAQQRYFEEQPPAGSMMFKDVSAIAPTGWLAFALNWVQQRRNYANTIEFPVSVGYRWDPQQAIGHYCSTKGMIGSDAIQKCVDRPIGTPDKNWIVNVALLWGVVDTNKGYWRASVGPYFQFKSASQEVHAGVKVPFYFNSAPLVTDKTVYQGVLRLTPAVGATYDDTNGWSLELTITVDVLGQRNLFLRALDWK